MPSEKHIVLSRMALVWLENKATQRGIRGCEEVILGNGYVCDSAAICGLQMAWEKQFVGVDRLNDAADDYSFVFETKVSRSDFLKTFAKNGHIGDRLIQKANFHFVVAAKKIVSADEVPDFWGLLEESRGGLKLVKLPKYLIRTKEQLHEFGYILLRSGHSRKFTYNIEIKPEKYFGSNLLWNKRREFTDLPNSEQNVHGSVATMPNSSNDADKQIKQNPFGG